MFLLHHRPWLKGSLIPLKNANPIKIPQIDHAKLDMNGSCLQMLLRMLQVKCPRIALIPLIPLTRTKPISAVSVIKVSLASGAHFKSPARRSRRGRRTGRKPRGRTRTRRNRLPGFGLVRGWHGHRRVEGPQRVRRRRRTIVREWGRTGGHRWTRRSGRDDRRRSVELSRFGAKNFRRKLRRLLRLILRMLLLLLLLLLLRLPRATKEPRDETCAKRRKKGLNYAFEVNFTC